MEKVKIDLQDISKSYYSETTVTQALRKISLTFWESEFVAITGESGSGKSTLLNIIGGMDTFDEGEMFVDGQPTFQYDEQDWVCLSGLQPGGALYGAYKCYECAPDYGA